MGGEECWTLVAYLKVPDLIASFPVIAAQSPTISTGYGPCGAASALVAPVLDQLWSYRWRRARWPLPVCVSLGVSFGFHQVIVSKRRSRREWFGTSFRAVLKSVASLPAIQRPNFASIFCFHFHSPSLLPTPREWTSILLTSPVLNPFDIRNNFSSMSL